MASRPGSLLEHYFIIGDLDWWDGSTSRCYFRFHQIPPSPLDNEENEDKYVVVTAEDCTPTGDREELFTQLEQDLIKQIRVSDFSVCVTMCVAWHVWVMCVCMCVVCVCVCMCTCVCLWLSVFECAVMLVFLSQPFHSTEQDLIKEILGGGGGVIFWQQFLQNQPAILLFIYFPSDIQVAFCILSSCLWWKMYDKHRALDIFLSCSFRFIFQTYWFGVSYIQLFVF